MIDIFQSECSFFCQTSVQKCSEKFLGLLCLSFISVYYLHMYASKLHLLLTDDVMKLNILFGCQNML